MRSLCSLAGAVILLPLAASAANPPVAVVGIVFPRDSAWRVVVTNIGARSLRV